MDNVIDFNSERDKRPLKQPTIPGIATDVDLVDFAKEKEAREPAITGELRCLQCEHKWQGVAPIGSDKFGFECPSCHALKGIFQALVYPRKGEANMQCSCGNQFYWVMKDRILCPICGNDKEICGPGTHDEGPKTYA